MSKYTLGISLGFNSSASLWKDDLCLGSVSQERITGSRNTKELPLEAAKSLMYRYAPECKELDIAYSHYETLSFRYLNRYSPIAVPTSGADNKPFSPEDAMKQIFSNYLDVYINSMERIEHHTAHVYSAYAVYGIKTENYYALTLDGFGDGISGRLIKHTDKGRETVVELDMRHSLALYYQFVTGALGFKEHQHEGKITGIATSDRVKRMMVGAYKSVCKMLESLYCGHEPIDTELTDDEKESVECSSIIDFEVFLKMKKFIYKSVRDLLPEDYSSKNILECQEALDIAAAVHDFVKARVEDLIYNYTVPYQMSGISSIYLAGGLFANVDINRSFGRRFRHIYISPAMGDEGTAMGAALALINRKDMWKHRDRFNPDYIISGSLPICEVESDTYYSAEDIVDCLQAKEPVAHVCRGRAEFGPRALLKRSTIFPAHREDVSSELNKRMGRNDFMPFAPFCRAEDAAVLFEDFDKYKESSQFMTVSFRCKDVELCKRLFPAAVHDNGTCRVQVIFKDIPCEEFAYSILEAWFNRTGQPLLINTSFNTHGMPTSCTREQCNETYIRSNSYGSLLIF